VTAALCVPQGAADAGPSAQRIKDGPGLLQELLGDHANESDSGDKRATHPAPAGHGLYDGVWHADANQLLLIKQVHSTLYLEGSDAQSAWQAQCVLSSSQARCIGSGISSRNGAFDYETTLHLQSSALSSAWQRSFDSGRNQSGRTCFKPR